LPHLPTPRQALPSGECYRTDKFPRYLHTFSRNFELPRVKSINVSGYKYGLVRGHIGWIIWRDEAYLRKNLISELPYTGKAQKTLILSSSDLDNQVIVQYFNLAHLGMMGYREVMENRLAKARLLSNGVEKTGYYT
jgi:glutamate decarboxylase